MCKINVDGNLHSISEKPQYDFITNTGFYIIEPELLELIPGNTYFDMTDLIQKVIQNTSKIGGIEKEDLGLDFLERLTGHANWKKCSFNTIEVMSLVESERISLRRHTKLDFNGKMKSATLIIFGWI